MNGPTARLLCTVRVAVAAVAFLLAGPPVPASAVQGGHPVDANRYPWLAAIGSPAMFLRPSGQFCAGELIAPDRMLTAAHCVAFARTVPELFTVTFGRSDLRDRGGTTVGVRDIAVNPRFHETDFHGTTVEHDDIAVLTLTRPQQRPTVAMTTDVHRTATATVLGWGGTADNGFGNTQLEQAEIPLVGDRACESAYGAAFESPTMLCAGSPQADTGNFDSGGPLLMAGRLAALTSWAMGTARPGYPGVYASLSLLSSLPTTSAP